jgi:hypothetical protein
VVFIVRTFKTNAGTAGNRSTVFAGLKAFFFGEVGHISGAHIAGMRGDIV